MFYHQAIRLLVSRMTPLSSSRGTTMFGFRKRHHDEHVAKINDLADAYSPAILQGKIASVQGRLMAHHLLISCIVDQMREEDRKKLILVLKEILGRGLSGNPQWLSEDLKAAYNNGLSVELQAMVESIDAKTY
jgi:hypothetical protein